MTEQVTAPDAVTCFCLSGKENNMGERRELLRKTMQFKVTAIDSAAGTFDGIGNWVGLKDRVKDVVLPGAYKQTIAANKGKVFLLADHETGLQDRVGVVYLSETPEGHLQVNGVLNLEKNSAQAVYADLKFYQQHELPLGLSIGYAIPDGKSYYKNDTRYITEVELWEVSIVTFPANPKATVTAVKNNSSPVEGEKMNRYEALLEAKTADLLTVVSQAARVSELREMGWRYESAFNDVRWKIIEDDSLTNEEKLAKLSEIYDQYKSLMMGVHTAVLAIESTGGSDADDEAAPAAEAPETKAGNRHNASDRAAIQEIRQHHEQMGACLTKLLSDTEPNEKSTPPAQESGEEPAPEHKRITDLLEHNIAVLSQ